MYVIVVWMSMEYVRLGKGGPKVSVIGMGSWQMGDATWGKDVNEENSIAAIKRSLELGVNFIDTAELYGDGRSEGIIGKAIKDVDRNGMVMATKVSGKHLRYNDVIKACEGSLKRLGLKEIDLYQVHWPDPFEQVPLHHTMKAMEQLQKEGRIKAIGVSNFAVRDLKEAMSLLSHSEIVSDQVRLNMLQRDSEEEVLQFCREERISVIAWSPLGQGLLTGKYGFDRKPMDEMRSDNKLFTESNLREESKLLEVLHSIANSRKKTVSQIALNWLMTQRKVIPIPGAKNPTQAEQNAGATGWKLNKQEAQRIGEVLDKIRIDSF